MSNELKKIAEEIREIKAELGDKSWWEILFTYLEHGNGAKSLSREEQKLAQDIIKFVDNEVFNVSEYAYFESYGDEFEEYGIDDGNMYKHINAGMYDYGEDMGYGFFEYGEPNPWVSNGRRQSSGPSYSNTLNYKKDLKSAAKWLQRQF